MCWGEVNPAAKQTRLRKTKYLPFCFGLCADQHSKGDAKQPTWIQTNDSFSTQNCRLIQQNVSLITRGSCGEEVLVTQVDSESENERAGPLVATLFIICMLCILFLWYNTEQIKNKHSWMESIKGRAAYSDLTACKTICYISNCVHYYCTHRNVG